MKKRWLSRVRLFDSSNERNYTAHQRIVKEGIDDEAAMREHYGLASVTDWIWEWVGGDNDLLVMRF